MNVTKDGPKLIFVSEAMDDDTAFKTAFERLKRKYSPSAIYVSLVGCEGGNVFTWCHGDATIGSMELARDILNRRITIKTLEEEGLIRCEK